MLVSRDSSLKKSVIIYCTCPQVVVVFEWWLRISCYMFHFDCIQQQTDANGDLGCLPYNALFKIKMLQNVLHRENILGFSNFSKMSSLKNLKGSSEKTSYRFWNNMSLNKCSIPYCSSLNTAILNYRDVIVVAAMLKTRFYFSKYRSGGPGAPSLDRIRITHSPSKRIQTDLTLIYSLGGPAGAVVLLACRNKQPSVIAAGLREWWLNSVRERRGGVCSHNSLVDPPVASLI